MLELSGVVAVDIRECDAGRVRLASCSARLSHDWSARKRLTASVLAGAPLAAVATAAEQGSGPATSYFLLFFVIVIICTSRIKYLRSYLSPWWYLDNTHSYM